MVGWPKFKLSSNFPFSASSPEPSGFSGANQGSRGEMERMQKGLCDPACQAKTYLERSAEFQKQIVSLRESRVLQDQKQRMREERATRMSFQFKSILSQMKQAQEDAFVAQERNMRLLGLISWSQAGQRCLGDTDEWPNCHLVNHQPAVAPQKTLKNDQSVAISESNCAGSSVKIPASNNTSKTGSARVDFSSNENSSGFSRIDRALSSRYDEEETRQSGSHQSSPQGFPKEDTDDFIVGQQQRAGKVTGTNADEKTNYLAMGEYPQCAKMTTETFDNSFSHSDSIAMRLELFDLNHPRDHGLQALCKADLHIVGDDRDLKNSTLSADGGSPLKTSSKEDTSKRTGVETSTILLQRNVFSKIEKNDFFPDVGDPVVYGREGEESEMLSCPDMSPTQIEEAKTKYLEATSSLPSDVMEQDEEQENLRNLITSWTPNEKLSVLKTLKNTMFLWEDQSFQFGCWPESETLLSSVFAAKNSQVKLFEYLEVQEDISRPLTCCGAVYELVKVYPPENLIPPKFITDFFQSDGWNSRLQDGLTFEHLEVYQEEHSQFWQMLIHHSICVKDLNLGSLKEVATVLRDIFCPRDSLEELSPELGVNVRENLLHFLIQGFKGREAGQGQNTFKEMDVSSVPVSYNFMIPVENNSRYEVKRLQTYKVEAAHPSIRDVVVSEALELNLLRYEFLNIATGYKSERQRRSKKGLFSSLGSLVRTPFKLWRSRGMSQGAENMEDGFVRLLSPKRNVLRVQ